VGIETDEPEEEGSEVTAPITLPKEDKDISAKGKSDLKDKIYKAPPKFKPKRRKTSPTEWDYKSKRTEYMQDYRADGKDLETGNRYVKKLKGA
jgi:hypothetical protein